MREVFADALEEAPALMVLLGKTFHHLDAAECLAQRSSQSGLALLHIVRAGVKASPIKVNNRKIKGEACCAEEGHFPVQEKHDRRRQSEGDETVRHRRERCGDELLHGGGIVDDAVHQARCALGFVKREVQHLQVVEKGAADVENNALAGIEEEVVVSIANKIAHGFEDQEYEHNSGKERHIPPWYGFINHQLHKKRRHRSDGHRDEVAQRRNSQQTFVAANVAPQPRCHRHRKITH